MGNRTGLILVALSVTLSQVSAAQFPRLPTELPPSIWPGSQIQPGIRIPTAGRLPAGNRPGAVTPRQRNPLGAGYLVEPYYSSPYGYAYGYGDGYADASSSDYAAAYYNGYSDAGYALQGGYQPPYAPLVAVAPMTMAAAGAPQQMAIAYVGYGSSATTYRPIPFTMLPNGSMHADLSAGSSAIIQACKPQSAGAHAPDAAPLYVPSAPTATTGSASSASGIVTHPVLAAAPAAGGMCWAHDGNDNPVIAWP